MYSVLNDIGYIKYHAQELLLNASNYNYEEMIIISENLIDKINNLKEKAIEIQKDKPLLPTSKSCETIIYTLNNIIRLCKVHSRIVESKIEYELIPLIKELYDNFYYFAIVYDDKKEIENYYSNDFKNHGFISQNINTYIEESVNNDKYKYDVSILVLAYNKLEYTKQCIESVLKYTPININYEFILVNNGSNDGTKEYFDSLYVEKTIHLLHNHFHDSRCAKNIIEGKYLLTISNDVIVTENYIQNLLKCIESDENIGMVVPSTSNVSNRQSINVDYKTLEDMHRFTKENNVSDSNRWEQRTRLVNPIALYRSKALLSSKGIGFIDKAFIYSEFGDDALSLRFRRAGYKLILSKDTYCHHYGSVTNREAQINNNTLVKSRQIFIDRHKVDAWNSGFCYDVELINCIDFNIAYPMNILGINSGFGSNLLKIREEYKSRGNNKIVLHYLLDSKNKLYKDDLVNYGKVKYEQFDIIESYKTKKYFNIILIENNVMNIIYPAIIEIYLERLKDSGILAIRASNDDEMLLLNGLNYTEKIIGESAWYIWRKK
jgi:GT2 family glycosyltransferase